MIYVFEADEDDYDDYYKVRSCPSDIYWNGYTSKPDYLTFKRIYMDRIQSKAFYRPEERKIYLVKTDKQEIVGFTQLIFHTDSVEISYTITDQYQGNGYATEALKQTIVYAKEYNDHLVIQIRDDNIASQRVALKCGFTKSETYQENEYPECGIVKLRKYVLENS